MGNNSAERQHKKCCEIINQFIFVCHKLIKKRERTVYGFSRSAVTRRSPISESGASALKFIFIFLSRTPQCVDCTTYSVWRTELLVMVNISYILCNIACMTFGMSRKKLKNIILIESRAGHSRDILLRCQLKAFLS